jgi:pimeloyl-ACP methyl ester carboxylesterase
VVLLHGWPNSAWLRRHQVPVLADSGFRVIAPDMRGFERSGGAEEVAAYSLRNAAADVNTILDHLGIQAAHIAGHDWGAGVACSRPSSARIASAR